MLAVALGILGEELPANRFGRDHVVIAIVADPLGQVVGNVEGCGGRHSIFVIDEVDRSHIVFGLSPDVIRQNNHVGTKKIAVSKNHLHIERRGR